MTGRMVAIDRRDLESGDIRKSMKPAATQARSHVTTAQQQPLVSVLIAVAGGITADRWLGWSLAAWWWLAVGSWLAWVSLWRGWPNRGTALPLLLSAAAVAGAWHHCWWSLYAPDDLWLFARGSGHPAAVDARIVGGPRLLRAGPRDPLRTLPALDRTLVDVELLGIRDGRDWRGASGRALLVAYDELSQLDAGDRLCVFGQLSAARGPENPGEFDFAAHARAERRQCVVHVDVLPCITRTAVGQSWRVPALADRLRRGGQQLLHQYIAPRYAGLASAMFLGIREDLEPEDSQAFLETGTIHLLICIRYVKSSEIPEFSDGFTLKLD